MSIACSRWSIEERNEGEQERWMDCGSGGRKGKKVQHPVRRCVAQSLEPKFSDTRITSRQEGVRLFLRSYEFYSTHERTERNAVCLRKESCIKFPATGRIEISSPFLSSCFSYKWIMWIIKSVGEEGAEQKGKQEKRRQTNERWQANEKWTTTSWFLDPVVDTHWLTDSSSLHFFLLPFFPSASCPLLSLSLFLLSITRRAERRRLWTYTPFPPKWPPLTLKRLFDKAFTSFLFPLLRLEEKKWSYIPAGHWHPFSRGERREKKGHTRRVMRNEKECQTSGCRTQPVHVDARVNCAMHSMIFTVSVTNGTQWVGQTAAIDMEMCGERYRLVTWEWRNATNRESHTLCAHLFFKPWHQLTVSEPRGETFHSLPPHVCEWVRSQRAKRREKWVLVEDHCVFPLTNCMII